MAKDKTALSGSDSWGRDKGLMVVLATIALMAALNFSPFPIPNPGPILMLVIAYSAYLGGTSAGLASAAIAILFFALQLMQPGGSYSNFDLGRVFVFVLVSPTMAVMVGTLRRRSELYNAAARDAAVRQAYLEEHLRSEREIKDALREKETLLNTVSTGIALLKDRRYVWVNQAMSDISGYTEEELIGQPTGSMYASLDDFERVGQEAYPLLSQGARYETELAIRRKNGEPGWVRVNGRAIDPSDLAKGSIWVMEDVTGQRRTQMALQASEALLKATIDNIPFDFWARDREMRCIMQSEATIRTWGDQLGKGIEDSGAASGSQATWMHNNRRALAGEVVRGEVSYETGGEKRWYYSVVAPIRQGKEITGILGMNVDITDRKYSEQALKESEQRFRTIFENMPAGIVMVGRDRRFIKVNRSMARMLGYSEEELLRMTIDEVTYAEDLDASLALTEKVFDKEMPSYEFEKRYVRRDGTLFWAHVVGAAIRDEQGRPLYAISSVEDITDRKDSERRRIETLERQRDVLVREVHHRIKNNLQGVVGLLRLHQRNDPKLSETIQAAISRVNAIALIHGIQSKESGTEVSLHDIVREISEDKGRTFPEVPIDVCLSEDCRNYLLAENETVSIALVLNELLINAIKACMKDPDIKAIRIGCEAGGTSARVKIWNQCGELPKGFDFEAGAGIGTGLAIVKSLLPREGVRLDFERPSSGGVRAVLSVSSPVLVTRMRI